MSRIFFTFAALMGFSTVLLADQAQDGPFAVVELFSSEGCSACPSADLLISKLTTWARQNNEPVYPLVFHVDYWNDKGWRDVFSRPEFTQRQDEYAKIFKDQQIHTPEMIVNGSDAFDGSDQEQLQNDLDNELSMSSNIKLKISLIKEDGGPIIVNIHCEGYAKGDLINVALVERGLSTEVTAGENAGRMLHHDNVVREFRSLPLMQDTSQVKIPIDKIDDPAQASVIVYVQDHQTMLIEDAKQMDLEND